DRAIVPRAVEKIDLDVRVILSAAARQTREEPPHFVEWCIWTGSHLPGIVDVEVLKNDLPDRTRKRLHGIAGKRKEIAAPHPKDVIAEFSDCMRADSPA